MDYLEIVFDNYNENRQAARDQLNLPPWFTRFWIDDVWKNADESVEIDQSQTSIVIEVSYARQGDRCFQIREYCVYDWRVYVRTGTLCLYLRVDRTALREAETFARRFLVRAVLAELADYQNPTTGVAAGLVDIGLMAVGSAIPPILGDIFSAADMGELLDSVQDITDQVEARLREIARLRALDGTKIAEYPNVRNRYRGERVKSFSSVEIVEVECTDWILKLPEGEVIRVPDHDEPLYPPLPLSDEIGEGFDELRELGASSEGGPRGALRQAKRLEQRLRAAWGRGEEPCREPQGGPPG